MAETPATKRSKYISQFYSEDHIVAKPAYQEVLSPDSAGKRFNVDHGDQEATSPGPLTPMSSSSAIASEQEIDSLSSQIGPRQLRIAVAAAYEDATQSWLGSPSTETLERLAYALSRVHAEDIDPISAEKVITRAHSFLDRKSTAEALLVCQLAVRYYLKDLDVPSIKSSEKFELYTTMFREVANRNTLSSSETILLAQTIELWTALANKGDVEEHRGYQLISSSLQWIFRPSPMASGGANVRYRFINLVVATFAHMPRGGRYRAANDLLSVLFHSNGFTPDAVYVLLRLVAVTGSVPMSVWREATALRRRQLLESEAALKHKEAVAFCQMISRKIIEIGYASSKGSDSRQHVQQFLEECTNSLMSPQLPSAEVLVSSFIATVFSLSQSHRDRRYGLFSFSILRTFHDTLARLQVDESTVDPVGILMAIQSPEQALYFASRQCVISEQPYFDLQMALESSRSALKSSCVSEHEWLAFLNQWPIASYYQHICEQLCSLADREDMPDTIQIELFKVLERVVIHDPTKMNSRWLDRLSYASSTVCEALVPVIASVFRVSTDKPYPILHKLGTRLAVPGVKQFKKRAITFFASVAEISTEAHEIAWLYLLIALADSDQSVSDVALDKATVMFFAALSNDDLDPRLSKAWLRARSNAGENGYLVQEGLQKLVTSLSVSKEGSRVRYLVSSLLDNEELDIAALLVEANGTFMPLSKVKVAFAEVTKASIKQLPCLRMLCAALLARPRIILAPATASEMFSFLITKLKTCTEEEIEYSGPILQELVSLGGHEVQQERKRKLKAVMESSLVKFCELRTKPQLSQLDSVILRQLVIIIGCVRYWKIDLSLEATSLIMEKLVNCGHCAQAGSMLSQVTVRTVFRIAAAHRVLFSNKEVDSYLSSLRQGSPEFECFMKLLLQYNWHETNYGDGTNAHPELRTILNSDDRSSTGRENLRTMLMGSNQRNDVLATSSMLQRYLSHILVQADRNQNVVALRIISKALDHYLIVADRCLPLVVSLCFSVKQSVSQAALASYAKICGRWPASVLTKFVSGLKLCSENERDSIQTGPFARMWQLTKASQPQGNIKVLIGAVVSSLGHESPDIYLELVIMGLMQTQLDFKDAKVLRLGLVESVTSFSPRNKSHRAHHIARMIVVHVFETWLTRCYDLATTKDGMQGSGDSETLDYLDIASILQRFSCDREFAKRAFEELLDEQYAYGSAELAMLVYGEGSKRQRTIDETLASPPSYKKRLLAQSL